jgi:hypothetical protein
MRDGVLLFQLQLQPEAGLLADTVSALEITSR